MKSKKDKHKGKDKHKKHRKSRKSSRADRDSSSDSDAPRDVNAELERSRLAARAVREILGHDYSLKTDLREVISKLDGGEALSVDGVQDRYVRSRLHTMLSNLPQVRATPSREYFRRSRGNSSILGFLAPILNESREQLAAYAPTPAAPSRSDDGAATGQAELSPGGAGTESPLRRETKRPRETTTASTAMPCEEQHAVIIGAAMPPPGLWRQGVDDASTGAGLPERDGVVGDAGAREESHEERARGTALIDRRGNTLSHEPERGCEPGASSTGGAPEPQVFKKVRGPAMPPPEVLAAAAAAWGNEGDDDDDDMLGPMPPELEAEAEAAGDDERGAEVVRVLRVLTEHAASLAGLGAAEAVKRPPDAYAVLGVDAAAPAAVIKRRYMRLSLLIHPDKCGHAGAADSFQAVASAAAVLQDRSKRAALDDARRDAALREEFLQESAARDRERAWRMARGEATPEDLAAGPGPSAGPPARETWMTELPPERTANAGVPASGGPFRGFSQSGIKSRGDTSGWTMTPSQRAAQLESGSTGQGMLAGAVAPAPSRAAATAAAMDAFDAASRKRSLLEQHQAEQGKRKRKTDAAASQDWDPATQPWRPFDREKDLVAGRGDVKSAKDRLAGLPSLGSRFGGAGGAASGQRTFL